MANRTRGELLAIADTAKHDAFNHAGNCCWSDDFDQEIGKPLGKATKDGYAYHRDFEHCSVDVNLKTKTSSIVWKPVDRIITPSKDDIKK